MIGRRGLLTVGFLWLCCSMQQAGAEKGQDLLRSVREAIPRHPLAIRGELQTVNRFGDIESRRGLELHLYWGEAPPKAELELSDAFGRVLDKLSVRYQENAPAIVQRTLPDHPTKPDAIAFTEEIEGTAFTWSDLALDFLWWPKAELIRRESLRGRSCAVVEARPASADHSPYAFIRLWIDEEAAALLQAEGYDEQKKLQRRLSVQSFRRVQGAWTIGNVDVEMVPERRKTRLRVREALPL